MGDPFEAFAHAAGKHFAAPDRAVVAVTGAVETHADDTLIPGATLGKDGGDVGAMMLHGAFFRRGKFSGMERGYILGMRVVYKQQFVRINFIHRQQIVNGFAESAKRFVVIEVANMLADESLASNDQCDRIFEVGAERQDRTVGWKCRSGAGRVTASAPQNCGPESAGARDGIVHAAGDGALAD